MAPPYGFIRTPYLKWFDLASRANYDVSIIKIKQKYSDLISSNIEKIDLWWEENKGTPYGYPNFLWGWIDTIDSNLPGNLDKHFFTMMVSFAFRKNISTKNLTSFLIEGLNQRINYYFNDQNSYNWQGILNWSYRHNYLIWDLWTLPEMDKWKYNNKYARVCDTLILTFFKLVGIINDQIEITEFTPRDLYMIQLWESWNKTNNHLSVLGEYQIDLPSFNSVPLYSNMNQKCSTIPLKYIRQDNC